MTDRTNRLLAAAGAVALSACFAWGQDSVPQEQRMGQLERKIAALEAKQAASSKDLASTIDSMLRDAEKRSQLLATSGEAAAGYDNGFFIRAGDSWVLRPGAQFQFRNVTNYRDDAKPDGSSSTDNGFEVRRMKLELAGNAFSRDLTYFFNWQVDRDSGSFLLEEAWAKYFFADEWGMRAGQIKDLTTHEFLMSSKRLLAADVSMMDQAIGGSAAGYTQAVTAIYGGARSNNNPLNVEVGYTDGANQLNTNFVSRGEPLPDPTLTVPAAGSPKAHTFDWGVAGRAEYKVMGDWKSYADFTAKGTKEDLLVIGAGGDWSQGGDGDLLIASGDVQYENPSGLGLYAAAVYHMLNSDISSTGASTSDWGFLAQAGYLINGNWEVFGRYDAIVYSPSIATSTASEDVFHEITIGVNYYLGQDGSAGHRAKITVDLSWLPNGAPASLSGIDVLDKNNFENELMLRAQFQLLI